MKDQSEFYSYIAWKTPEEMHFSSLQWISYLDFIRDEHRFFENILKNYTLPILNAQLFEKAKGLVNELIISEKKESELSGKLITHRNKLQILIDGNDQLKEEQEYTATHADLKMEVSRYTDSYRALKKEIFEIISFALKKQKENLLLP